MCKVLSKRKLNVVFDNISCTRQALFLNYWRTLRGERQQIISESVSTSKKTLKYIFKLAVCLDREVCIKGLIFRFHPNTCIIEHFDLILLDRSVDPLHSAIEPILQFACLKDKLNEASMNKTILWDDVTQFH